MDVIGWDNLIGLPAAIVVLLAILGFFLRVLPYWREIKLAEIKVRETEANSRTNEASMFGQQSNALSQISNVLQQTVVDSRRDTDKMQILQRVNADATDKILNKLDMFDELADGHSSICERLDHLEQKLEEKDS